MDEDQQGVKEEVTSVESPTTPETPEVNEDKVAETSSTEEVNASEESNAEGADKKTANARIRELNAKLKEEREKAKSLAEKIADFTGSVEPGGQAPPYQPQFEPGAELTLDQVKAEVARMAQAASQLEIQKERALNRIHADSQEAVLTYPQLNPKSAEFDKELSESISEAVEAQAKVLVGFDRAGKPVYNVNPTVNVKGIVSSLMKPYLRSLEKSKGQAEENMTKQVSQAALRPVAVKADEKKAEDMSKEELEAKLGIFYS